ncbi:TetR family transcriptional regulator [Nocardia sp. 852002-20019_SCH5090214]|jgi:AcrR family transcriptional regulator|uniref:TetR/AcrR family transcriptional regulator n=1 Tax=Nocardia nova TaxID=37330 RepID=A0A2S6A3T1_9NOCA|nr:MULTISPECIES: TetR/AcrR family transcriptional regulator [Nocardia]OBF80845.1 TetR family transcriptional regulator [Mycobacterium sp. 852002-51759_SCH5129042]MBF6278258.1 TetR/AcrR family transcriptional regulator [Nocardia nova]OBA43199.1 TetR family transcriptional regulator [Nocardia sp. 852002-51101_SCH5132738]OBA67854.1 TetR family transcriptional regulator [Nocardia sp. 852002-20019_SCH5090214]OBB41106.1 TetR family transcriptional regulator [Nocardia sp. 852002-51244_SCH5132740]
MADSPHTPKTGSRPWRGREPADRIAARRERLLRAGYELMAGVGAAETSMRGVCRQAGLTERYFYESFANLDDLMTTVLENTVEQCRDRLLAALAEAPEERDLLFGHVVRAFTDFLTEDPRRGRILFVESIATPALTRRGSELVAVITGPIAAVIAADDTDTPAPDETDATLNAMAIFGALAYCYRPYLIGDITIDRDRFDNHAAAIIRQLSTVRSAPVLR